MEYTILILLLPLLSFLTLGIGGKWMTHRTAGIIGTTVLAVVALLSYATAWQYFSAPRLADGTFATLMPYNVTWLPFTPTLSIDLGILLDPISVMMLIVISTVSLMVHVYSFGYMKGERGFQRYYAFLSLFTMSMLGLVVATNIFQMYLNLEKSDEHDAPALVGVDATTKQQEAIRNGEEIGCVSQQPYAMGYQTIWAAVETTAPKKSVVIEKNVLSNPAWIDADCLDDPDYSGYLYTE